MTKRPPRWTQPEIDYLDGLAGDIPWPELVRQMKHQATRQGWPRRSAAAILKRLHRTNQAGGGRHGKWLTHGAVAELLGCPNTRVDAWARRPCVREILQPRLYGKTRYVHRDSWRQLAREMPRMLGGFGVDALYALLEDRELAEQVAAAYPAALGDWAIRCIETGHTWPSCIAAARELNIHHSTISLAIRRRQPVKSLGLTFEAPRRVA